MKMKKMLTIGILSLSLVALAGCVDDPENGMEEEPLNDPPMEDEVDNGDED